MFEGRDYAVTFHGDNIKDKIYSVRKDYLDQFTGAILYNTKTEHWYDFYTSDHQHTALLPNTEENKNKLKKICLDLVAGK